MDFKRMRLNHLVNKELNFYPKKSQMADESEVINRYDSDEEKDESEIEDGYDLVPNETNEGDDGDVGVKSALPSVEKIVDIKEELSSTENFETAKKIVNIANKNFYSSCLRTTDKKFTRNFEKCEGDYFDEELIEMLENLNLKNLNENDANNESNSAHLALENFLSEFESRVSHENSNLTLFYLNIFQFFTCKLLSSEIFYLKQKQNINKEDQSSSNSDNSNSTNSADKILLTSNFHSILHKILTITQNLFVNIFNLITKKNNNQHERIVSYLLSIGDNLLEIHINSKTKIYSDFNFIPNLLKIILLISSKENKSIFSEEENFYFYITKGRLKNIILHLNLILNSDSNCLHYFNVDQKKDIFNFSFNFLKENNLSNLFIPLVEIICGIIKSNSGQEFIDKFIEYMISFFLEFIDYYNFSEEKFWLLDKKVLRLNKVYFGVYKSFNGENISLFTLLFLKFFAVIYLNEETDNTDNNLFISVFENLIFKILETKKNNLLLIFYCILDDLLSTKFNVEFSVNLVIITNLFHCFSNLITHSDFELGKRKFFLNCLEYFIDNLLHDFKKITESYLCLGEKLSSNNLFSDLKCSCFSCSHTKREILSNDNFFSCPSCKCKTNLKLQIINIEENEENIDCGFCSMKKYFSSSYGDLFSQENNSELNLIETNEEIIEEFSKSKHNETENKSNNNMYEKFIKYQDSLYKDSFNFVRTNVLNFLLIFNKNENSFFSNNLDLSFKIFLKILISDQKMSLPIYKSFSENIFHFYESQKARIFNSLPDLFVDEITINYFYFFYFYINFLYAGHWRILDILLNENYSNLHWFIRYKSLKILDKILIFEGEKKIFQNFQPEMLGVFLNDSSFYVKEYSLEILFKLFKFKKIERYSFINILFEYVNDTSFLIRKRIVKALIGLLMEDKSNNDKDSFKTVNFIFLTKIIDDSESNKIKSLIYDFYFKIFSSSNKNEKMTKILIDIFIEILKDNEDVINSSNIFYEHYKNLFTVLIQEKNLNHKNLMTIVDYIFVNYILGTNEDDDKENYSKNCLIQALNLIKIISIFNCESILVYFESLLDFMKISDCNKNNTDVYSNENLFDNKIKQIICEIYGNILNKAESNIKSKHVYLLENYLIKLILTKPSQLMISSIDCYFKILSRGIVQFEKIKELSCKNYLFLKNQISNIIDTASEANANLRNKNKKNSNENTFAQGGVPLPVVSKSLTLLAYITYSSDADQLINIFEFMETYKIFQLKVAFNEGPEKIICENIFNIYKKFSLNHPNNSIKFRTFEALGFFWIRFPHKLINSKEIIDNIFQNISTDEEKSIVLRTFINFFNQTTLQIKKINESKNNTNEQSEFDYGSLHLFFEKFIMNFSCFLTTETNPLVRLQTINLIKIIVNLGNINVHNILPYIFASLFDHVNEIRHISAGILEKIIKISKEKFLNFIKDSLKISFSFQKIIYQIPSLINSFVKIKVNNEENEFAIQNENIFELLTYKLGKSLKDDNLNKKLLSKFISNFQEIKNLDNNVNLNSLNESISNFEFYEFVASLIGDFKFSNALDILSIFQMMYKEFSTELLVFKTKLKEYRDSSQIKIDNRLILLFFSLCLKSSLFKFLLAKYDNMDFYEEIIVKNFDDFVEKFTTNVSDRRNVTKMSKQQKKNDVSFSKELKNFKFYQFYQAVLVYIKKFMKIASKSKFSNYDKFKCIDMMKIFKDFNNLKIASVRLGVTKFKKNFNKFSEEKASELLSEVLFVKEVKKEPKSNKENKDMISKSKMSNKNTAIETSSPLKQPVKNGKKEQKEVTLTAAVNANNICSPTKEKKNFKNKTIRRRISLDLDKMELEEVTKEKDKNKKRRKILNK